MALSESQQQQMFNCNR